jgi:hypothetical protein
MQFKTGQKIATLGIIEERFELNQGIQYKIAGQYYFETVLFENVIKIKSFNWFFQVALYSKNKNLVKAAYQYIVTEHARDRFKKYDKKIVSRYNWLVANFASAASLLL